jgi:hypothetical protein
MEPIVRITAVELCFRRYSHAPKKMSGRKASSAIVTIVFGVLTPHWNGSLTNGPFSEG